MFVNSAPTIFRRSEKGEIGPSFSTSPLGFLNKYLIGLVTRLKG